MGTSGGCCFGVGGFGEPFQTFEIKKCHPPRPPGEEKAMAAGGIGCCMADGKIVCGGTHAVPGSHYPKPDSWNGFVILPFHSVRCLFYIHKEKTYRGFPAAWHLYFCGALVTA